MATEEIPATFNSSGVKWQSHAVDYAADHRLLRQHAAIVLGSDAPVAFAVGETGVAMIKAAKKIGCYPVEDVIIRAWDREHRKVGGGCSIGIQVYELDGIRFAEARFRYNHDLASSGLDFFVVDQSKYTKLYKACLLANRKAEPFSEKPLMPQAKIDQLWQNSIGFLDRHNIGQINKYGGRARRGIILSGAPGNGKTTACRWLWSECRRHNLEWKIVTPDLYREARRHGNVNDLFTVQQRGVIFFDDMDLAIRDREKGYEGEDQSVFLTAMDGIQPSLGVIFILTTNCELSLIDKAFKRPGRFDVIIEMKEPDAQLRHQFIKTWHSDITSSIDMKQAVNETAGYSYAELAEIKNLLVMNFSTTGAWSIKAAIELFKANRTEFATELRGRVGFGTQLFSPADNSNLFVPALIDEGSRS